MTEKKSKIPYFFAALFLVVLAVNIFYVYISKQSWRGVATENSYQKGLKYNEALKLAKEQEKLGWKIEIKYKNLGNLLGNSEIKLFDKNSKVITNAKIYIKLRNPVQDGLDFSQDLIFENGAYKSKIQFPAKGQWDFEIIAIKNKDSFQKVKRYIVR